MKRLVLIILLFCYSGMFSQIEYLNGYVIKGNDTINGYIKKEPLKTLHYKISMKTSLDSVMERIYLPADIEEFYIQNFGRFKSKHFNVRYVNDITKTTGLNPIETEKYIEEDMFAKVLTSGKINLYLFIDENSVNHYFIEKDTIYELYVKRKYDIVPDKNDSRDMNKVLITQKNYLGKLDYSLSDCPRIKPKIKNVRLNEQALTNIINEYNTLMGSTSEEEPKSSKVIIERGVGMGISLNNFFFYSSSNDLFENTTQPYNYSPSGGLYLNIIMPRLSYNFSVYTGIHYLNNKFTGKYDSINTDYDYHYDVNLNTHFIQLPILGKYTMTQYKIKPYVTAGVFLNFVVHSTNQMIIQAIGAYDERIDTSYVFKYVSGFDHEFHPALKNIELGYEIGLGVKTRMSKDISLFIESRFESGNGISKVVGFVNTSKYFSFVTGIEF